MSKTVGISMHTLYPANHSFVRNMLLICGKSVDICHTFRGIIGMSHVVKLLQTYLLALHVYPFHIFGVYGMAFYLC